MANDLKQCPAVVTLFPSVLFFTPSAGMKSCPIMCPTSYGVKTASRIKARGPAADWPDKVNLDTLLACFFTLGLGASLQKLMLVC